MKCFKNVTVYVEGKGLKKRSVIFDDSFSNKVCACRKCNKEKDKLTAYDYMKNKNLL